jgi:hypothetical protein
MPDPGSAHLWENGDPSGWRRHNVVRMNRSGHLLAGSMTTTHQALELALGTGIIGQAQAGFTGALAASTAMDAGWLFAATRKDPPERLLAFSAGVAIMTPVLHFTLFPWQLRRGLPVLTQAEGLPASVMPLYNAVLYGWAGAGVLAAVRDTPRRYRPFVAAGILAVIAIRPMAKEHFAWMEREAARNTRWWNRSWRRQGQ